MRGITGSKKGNEIINLIAEYGYLTSDEIQVFVGEKRKAFNLIGYLRRKDIIKSFQTNLIPKKGYYLPAEVKKMVNQLGRVSHIKTFFPSDYRSSRHFHQSNLIKVRLELEKIFNNFNPKFITENQLSRTKKMNSVVDGILEYEKEPGVKKKAAIEVELTLKNATGRKKKVKQLLVRVLSQVDVLFIFYTQEIIRTRLTEDIKEYIDTKGPIYFIQINDFLKQRYLVRATDIDGNGKDIFRKMV